MRRTIGGNAQDRRRRRRAESREAASIHDGLREIQDLAFTVVVAAGSGSTSLPLSDRDVSWDANGASAAVKKWAGADDAPNAKYASAFMVKDGDGSNFGDYHLPFADVIDGKLTAIWKGITAVAGALQGARGANITGADAAAAKSKVESYYAKARKQYGDDTIMVPWKDGSESSADLEALGEILSEGIALGGKPNPGTKKDKRLKDNQPGTGKDDADMSIDTTDDFETQARDELATAYVRIRPDLTGFKDEIATGIREAILEAVALAPAVEVPAPAEVLPDSTDEITPPEAAASSGEIPWHATFLPEGKLTEDGRSFAPGSVILPPDEQARQLPLTLMAMTKTSAEGGHDGAEVAGRIDDLYRQAPLIEADGVFSQEEYGQMIARMVGSEELTGLSVDVAPLEYEWVPRTGWFDESGDWIAVMNDETGEWGPAEGVEDERDKEIETIEDWLEAAENRVLVITKAVIGMATVCPFPAFGDASIALTAAGMPHAFQWRTKIEVDQAALVAAGLCEDCQEAEVVQLDVDVDDNLFVVTAAAAGHATLKPPAEWFADPELVELTPMTITDDGRIYGHAWQWETCHLSFDQCIVAPHSETNYAYYMLGEIECEDGERLSVGKITLDGPHAGTRLTRQQATAHYDNTGTVGAYVCFGEDEFGGWFAGAIAPDLSEEALVRLRGAVPSGDWRGVEGNLELVAILAVNVPGFPVPRGLVAAVNDEPVPVSLIAAGVVTDARLAALQRQIGDAIGGARVVPAILTDEINAEIRQVFEDAGFEA